MVEKFPISSFLYKNTVSLSVILNDASGCITMKVVEEHPICLFVPTRVHLPKQLKKIYYFTCFEISGLAYNKWSTRFFLYLHVRCVKNVKLKYTIHAIKLFNAWLWFIRVTRFDAN